MALQPFDVPGFSPRTEEAIARYLRDQDQLDVHPKMGASWEGFLLVQIVEGLGVTWDDCNFWRTQQGAELDLLVMNSCPICCARRQKCRAGPLLGIATGAVLMPRLRSSGESHSMFVPGRRVAGFSMRLADSATGSERTPATSADVLASAKPSRMKHALHELRNLFDVASWSPIVGAIP